MARKQRVEHGLTYHPLYPKWQDMVRRCHNPNDRRYPWYGAKGISVCDEWRENPESFIQWCLDQGWKLGMEIDKDLKFPGNTVYSPQTCTVVTHQQNMIAVVGRQSGRKTAKMKLFESEVREIIYRKNNGESSRNLAEKYGVSVTTINRLYRAA